jgi:hypothetical protein
VVVFYCVVFVATFAGLSLLTALGVGFLERVLLVLVVAGVNGVVRRLL